MLLRIREWDKHFENAESRKLKHLYWVPIPNKTHGEGYTALVDHPNGAAHLGAWYAIVEIASKQEAGCRGNLPKGIPQDLGGISRSLGRMSRLPADVFAEVIPRLLAIGWLESGESPDASGESPDASGESPDASGDIERELQRNRITVEEHTHKPYVRAPLAADLNGQTSERFQEFWDRYPRRTGKDETCREFISVVTVDHEAAFFACLENYLASDEVTRGIVMGSAKWIRENHRDGWAARWPAKTEPKRQLSVTERAKLRYEERKQAENGK